MADLDTVGKRASAFGFAVPWLAVLPEADSLDARSAGERAQLAYSYAGGIFRAPGGGIGHDRGYKKRIRLPDGSHVIVRSGRDLRVLLHRVIRAEPEQISEALQPVLSKPVAKRLAPVSTIEVPAPLLTEAFRREIAAALEPQRHAVLDAIVRDLANRRQRIIDEDEDALAAMLMLLAAM